MNYVEDHSGINFNALKQRGFSVFKFFLSDLLFINFRLFEEEYIATTEPCDNKKGFRIKYVYYGSWFRWNLPADQLGKIRKKAAVLLTADILLYVFAAVFSGGVNSFRLVAYPGIAALLGISLKTLGVMQFLLAKQRTTKSTFEDIGRRIRAWSVVQIAGVALAAIGCAYYLITYGFVMNWLITALLYILNGAAAALLMRMYVKIPVKVEKNDILEHVNAVTG